MRSTRTNRGSWLLFWQRSEHQLARITRAGEIQGHSGRFPKLSDSFVNSWSCFPQRPNHSHAHFSAGGQLNMESANTPHATMRQDLLNSFSSKQISPQLLHDPPTMVVLKQRAKQPVPQSLIVRLRSSYNCLPSDHELCTTWRSNHLR